jgi:hypothetical protein
MCSGGNVIVHLGKLVGDLDARQAAHENRIVVCLQKRGAMRENEVKLYTAAIRRVGHDIHNAAVESLVAQGVIQKRTTTRANSFILELFNHPDEREAVGPRVSTLGLTVP